MAVQDISFNDIYLEAETGFVIKQAKNIALHNVFLHVRQGSAIQTENVDGLELDAISSGIPVAGVPVISMANTSNAFIRNCMPVAGTNLFLHLRGKLTNRIFLQGNNFDLTKKIFDKAEDVTGSIIEK